jgi:GAF domain-containing protein
VIAYLGVPLITAQGQAIGTLCVIDHQPRIWTKDEISLVTDIAAAVVTEINLRTAQASTSRKLTPST